MTREWAGLIALNALFLGTGLALLAGLGLVRAPREAVRFAGLGLVTGWAALGIAASFALMLGAALTVLQTVALAGSLSAAGTLAARRLPACATARSRLTTRGADALAVAGAAVLVGYLTALFHWARLAEPTAWDAWAFWLPKAKTLVYFNGLDTGIGGFTSFANPEYPPLKPALDAIGFRFAGSVDAGHLMIQNWVVATAFFGALAALLGQRVRPAILWPSLAVLALLPNFRALVVSLLADESIMVLFTLAGVCGGLWLLDRDPRLVALAALFSAAAALTKNEGLMLGLVLVLLLAAVTRLRPWRELAILVTMPLAALIPWRLWMHAHGVPAAPEFRLGDLANPGYLAGRTDRLGTAVRELPPFLFAFDRWLLTVPLVLLLAAVLARRRAAFAAYAFGTLLLGFLGFAIVYWATSFPLDWYIATTAERVVSSLVVFAAALFPLLVSEAFEQHHDLAAARDG